MEISSEVLLKKSSVGIVQFFRYGFVSGIALVVDIGLLYLLHTIAGLHYSIAASLSFLSGMVIVYLGSIWWAFDVRTMEDQKKEVAIFAGVGIAGLFLNVLLLAFFVEIFALTVLTAKGFTVLFVFAFNFAARKALLFRRT